MSKNERISNQNTAKRVQYYRRRIGEYLNNGTWKEAAKLYSIIARLYADDGEYNKALRNYSKSITYNKKANEWEFTARTYINRAILLKSLGRDNESIECNSRALVYFKKARMWYNAARTYGTTAFFLSMIKNTERALLYYKQAIKYYNNAGNWQNEAKTYVNLSYFLWLEEQFDDSNAYLEEAIQIYYNNNDMESIFNTYENIGNKLAQKGRYQESIKRYYEGISFFKKTKHWENVASIYESIGASYSKSNDFNDALMNFRKSAIYFKKARNWSSAAELYTLISTNYSSINEFNTALRFYHIAIRYFQRDNNWANVARNYKEIGSIFFNQNKINEAIENFKNAEHFYNITADSLNLGQVEFLIGKCYLKLEKYDECLDTFKTVLTNFFQLKDWKKVATILINILKLLIDIKSFDEKAVYEVIEPFLSPNVFINEEIEPLLDILSKINEYLYKQENTNFSFYFLQSLEELYSRYKELEDFQEHIERFTDNLIGYLKVLRAKKLTKQNRFEEAILNYENAIKHFLIIENWESTIISYRSIGTIILRNYDLNEAIDYYIKAIELYQKFGRLDLISEIYAIIGEFYLKENDVENALTYYRTPLDYYEINENWDKLASLYQSIAFLYHNKDDFHSSIEYYLKAIENLEKIGDKENVPKNYIKIGDIFYYILHDINKAFDNYKLALERHHKPSTWNNVAKILSHMGDINFLERKFDAALDNYIEARKFYTLARNKIQNTNILIRLGTIYKFQFEDEEANKKFEEAKKNFKDSRKIIKRKKNWKIVAQSYYRIAKILIMQNKFHESFKSYKKSLKYDLEALKYHLHREEWKQIISLFKSILSTYDTFEVFKNFLTKFLIEFFIDAIELLKKSLHWPVIATSYKNIGKLQFSSGNFSDALAAYGNAIEYFKKDNNLIQIGLSYKQIGLIHFKKKEYDQAAIFLNKSIFEHEEAQKFDEIPKTKLLLSKIFAIKGNYEGALDIFQEVLNYFMEKENYFQYYMTYSNLGEFYSYHAKIEDALQIYSEVIKYFEEENNFNLVALNFTNKGELYYHQGNYTEAIECFENAARNYRKSKALDNVANCHEKIGNAYSKLRNPSRALAFYDKYITQNDLKNIAWEKIFKKLKIGDIYLNSDKLNAALKIYKEILEFNINNEEWSVSAVVHRRLGTIYSLQENYGDALEHFNKAVKFYTKIKDEDSIYRIKMNLAATHKNARNWYDAYKHYEDLVNYYTIHKPILEVANDFKVQSLRCQARIKENAGEIKEVVQVYKDIAHINLKRKAKWFYILYKYIYKIFKADLTSFEGEHKKALNQLQKMKKSLSLLYQQLSGEDFDENFLKLINFRRKQVDLYINRENAFISEENKEFYNASEYFQKCAELSKKLIPNTFKLDFRLYEGISLHFHAHAIRLKHQDALKKAKNVLWDKNVIEKYIIDNFYEAKNLFKEISQDLREQYLEYEITLLEGKKLEFENRDLARDEYMNAEEILRIIDPEKAKEFRESYHYLRPGRKGFPIEEFFLRKQPPGEETLEPCKMVDQIALKKYIKFDINKEEVHGYVGEDYKVIVTVIFPKEILDTLVNRDYYLFLVGTNQKYKFSTETDVSSYPFDFYLKGAKKEKIKVFQIQLLDDKERYMTHHPIEVSYREKPTEFIEFLEAEFGSNCFNRIIELINLGEFKLIHDSLDKILQNYENLSTNIKFHIDFFKIALEAFEYNLKYDFKDVWNTFLKLKNYDFHLLHQKYQDNFAEWVNKYYSNYFEELIQFNKKIAKNPKLKDFNPFVLEVLEYEIFKLYETKKEIDLSKKTIQFLESIMQKNLIKNYDINKNKVKWNLIPDESVDKYRQMYAQEKNIPIEQIYFSDKLGFQGLKILTMTLDNQFMDFFNNNQQAIRKVKSVRDSSTHGVILGEPKLFEEITSDCYDLITNLKNNYPKIYFNNPGLLKSQQNFFKEYLNFIETELLARKIDEDSFLRTKVSEIHKDVSEIKDGLNKYEDLYDIIIEFKGEFNKISQKFDNKLTTIIESNFTKILPKIKHMRLATKEDKRFMKNALGRLQKVYVRIKLLLKLEDVLVIEFECENPVCGHSYRFIYFDKTTFFKVLSITMKVASITNNLFNFISGRDSQFILWIQKNKHTLQKMNGDKIMLKAKITPEDAKFLYANLLGVEDENSKLLAETFDLVEGDNGDIKFYCKDCSPKRKILEIEM